MNLENATFRGKKIRHVQWHFIPVIVQLWVIQVCQKKDGIKVKQTNAWKSKGISPIPPKTLEFFRP